MSDLPSAIDAEDDDDELIEESDPCTPKEEVFAAAFSSPESETYGRATASAVVAGYSQPHNAAWRLRRRPRVVAKIAEYQKTTMAVIGKVFSDLENQRLLALAKVPPDIQAANRSSELQGKHLAMFTDRVVVDEVAVHEYDKRLALEYSRLARLRLEEMGDEILGLPVGEPVLEGKVEPAGPGALPDGEGKLNPGEKEDGA